MLASLAIKAAQPWTRAARCCVLPARAVAQTAIELVRLSPCAGKVRTRDHRAPRYCLMSCVGCSPISLGVHCEINVDDCSPFFDPVTLGPKCFNNGKCTDRVGGYSCICPPGFVGERCEGDVNECLSNPCDARGTQNCVQRVNDYKCECRPGYAGERRLLAAPCSACPPRAPRTPPCAPLHPPLSLCRASLRHRGGRLQGEALQERGDVRRGQQHRPWLHLQVPPGRCLLLSSSEHVVWALQVAEKENILVSIPSSSPRGCSACQGGGGGSPCDAQLCRTGSLPSRWWTMICTT